MTKQKVRKGQEEIEAEREAAVQALKE